MTHEQFEALVARLEAEARKRPGAYRAKVLLLALLGNGYLAAIVLFLLLLFLLLLGSILWLKAAGAKLALVVGVFLWIVLKALWIRLEPPQGTEIRPQQAPELFAMIDGLRRQLGAPRFHHVLMTDDFNAGVVQAPRLGIFGWPRNYLLIGLPLMKSLSPEQFKAVLAHEFGHLARGHGRMSNWLYRQRLRWSRLMDALEAAESKGSFLFRPFLRWFAPYFNAYSFPLARANEYEADATSMRLTSPRAAAEALTAVNVVGSYLEERYWPGIYRHADEQPQPSFSPFRGMAVAGDVDEASARAWLEQAMARPTTVDDTHPALKERLAAIGEAPRLALPVPGEAADRLLGGALASISEAFDQRWQASIERSWTKRHREVQEGRRELAELEAKGATGAELELGEAFRRATLTEIYGSGADGALEQFRALHARAPDHPAVCYALGARLLARDDGAGVPLVERAIQLDEDLLAAGAERLRDFHWRGGREAEADAWHRRLVERTELLQAAEKERASVNVRDKFEPHGLPAEALARLREQLGAIPGLKRAFLLRKRVQHRPERPLFVLGYTVRAPLGIGLKKRAAEVQQRIQEGVAFPGETLFFNVQGENYRFGRKFRWKRGARVL